MSALFTPFDEGVRFCRGFAGGFGLLLAVVFVVAEEHVVACVAVVMFSFADLEILTVALGRVFAELEVEDFFLKVNMLIC